MKVKALIYCTKAKPYLFKRIDKFAITNLYNGEWLYNGKIVCECEVDTEEIEDKFSYFDSWFNEGHHTKNMSNKELEKRSCLSYQDLCKYLGEGEPSEVVGYALHLSNVKERVMNLNQVYKHDNSYDNMFGWVQEEDKKYLPITKAPQNMMLVYVYENGRWVKYLLISIRPQWLCKILNGEKDVEVRRKVLKGMVE